MQLTFVSWRGVQPVVAVCFLIATCWLANLTLGQNASAPNVGAGQTPGMTAQNSQRAADELQKLAADAAASRADQASAVAASQQPREMNFLQLLIDGGPLMIPLVLISILVLSVSLERLINLRMGRILPRKLRRGLVEASEQRYPVEPQELYQMSLRYPSVTARVLENMLKKIGRPIPEMESAVQDACQREADRLYGTVRWLTAAAAIAPLLGLLGTVWGMILAFFETTQPGMGMNRTQQLAQGISIAFVNTLGGLSIAIPAAGFSHFFEGRIIKLMNLVQEHVQALIPRLERFEGVTRYDLELSGLVPRRPNSSVVPSPPVSSPAVTLPSNGPVVMPPQQTHDDGSSGRARETPRAGTSQPLTRQTRNR
ncbi:MAG: MotA/TolQ/ExbB proton channel family protein [Pirellulaceae bacterium]|nr:MotA/TolQ/ExbB proton channel family protein [Pirellulaceae bacterium]